MLDASRVTLRGVYLVKAYFAVNVEYAGGEKEPPLLLMPKWAFPTVTKRQDEKVMLQQHVVMQVWFRREGTNEELALAAAPLRLEVDLLGDYEIAGTPTETEIAEFAELAAVHVFPFVREAADRLSGQTWHPRITIPLTNLSAHWKAWKVREAELRAAKETAGGSAATGSAG